MFLLGLLTKTTDELVDRPMKGKMHKARLATSVAYGLVAGYLASTGPEFATLITAIVIGVLATGKIDSGEHQLGIAAMIAVIALLGLPEIIVLPFALLACLAVLDEALNDYADRRKAATVGKAERQGKGIAPRLLGARLLAEAGAAAIGLATGNWLYLIAMLSFDVAYSLVDKAVSRIPKIWAGAPK